MKEIDRILSSYWERKFGNSELMEGEYSDQSWIGFFDGDKLLLGTPNTTKDNQWFCNGEVFADAWNYFSLSPEEFYDSMRRFVNGKYELGIQNII